jgi:hypothetical protein
MNKRYRIISSTRSGVLKCASNREYAMSNGSESNKKPNTNAERLQEKKEYSESLTI